MMEWKNLRQGKGQNVQSFIEVFRKKALALNVSLDSQETLMKYNGARHNYIHHTLLLFNHANLNDVCAQATHLESRENNLQEGRIKKPSMFQNNKFKEKGKGKRTPQQRKRKEIPLALIARKMGMIMSTTRCHIHI